MSKNFFSKLKKILLSLVLCYVAGCVAEYFVEKPSIITDVFKGTIALAGLGVGLLISLFILLSNSSSPQGGADFKGTTESGDKIDQHYNARFITDPELMTNKTFNPCTYKDLPMVKKSGIMLRSLYTGGKLHLNFYDPIHTLVIGTTGSGKTTFIIDPTIRCLSHTAEKPCMVITDPKGEIYNNHSIQLREEGYRIITLDLRNPYASSRWNPMGNAYDMYQRAHKLTKEVKVYRDGTPSQVGAKTLQGVEYGKEWYVFQGVAFASKEMLNQELMSKKQELISEAENQLREIATTIVTTESKSDPGWERGAQDFLYGLMIAMLEDSLNPELGMTKEKFNFYNLNKIATTRDAGDNMMDTLKKYAQGRDVLSKVPALVNTVVNSAPNTTRSYLSVLQPKIAIFSDLGICYATSYSDISFADFTDQPTVLFIKVPDEKESRHCIATMCISQIYKALIDKASSMPDLKLKRPVYFLLDEFANLPKIDKMDSIITVARSRRIFFELVIQSYSQLDNKYGKECADTIKGNCNIQIFVGTEDQKTREEFSKMCGDVTIKVENKSTSKSEKKDSDKNTTTSYQTTTRPLIEPYELGQLPYDVNIVKIYGQPAIKTQMTQWFKCPVFDKRKAADEYVPGRALDEHAIFYDIKERNNKVIKKKPNPFDDFDF